MKYLASWFALVVGCLAVVLPAAGSAQETSSGKRKVEKTDEQWAKLLTREQFLVTRRKATEAPFTGRYATSHSRGVYTCVCCGADLFSSLAKFDSGTGWPSFDRPINPRGIEQAPDHEMAEPRMEVRCVDCGAHLGHVFNDGPTATGLRYCINSAALKLEPATATKNASDAKGKGKAKARPGATPGEGDAPADAKPPKDESR
jgi:peptide-methionine (R)-S-oxide reductase